MLTIEENIEEEQSLVRKKVNRRTVISVRNLTQKQNFQVPLRNKMLRDHSQISIKQRSLDETEMKRTKIPSVRPKNVEKPTKKKDRPIKGRCEPAKSYTTVKLLQRDVVRPNTKRSEGKTTTRERDEQHKTKTGSQGRIETNKQRSRKQSKKIKSPRDRHYPGIPPAETKSRIGERPAELTRFRNITLNDEVLRMFEVTESKIVQEDELTCIDCELLEKIYNRLDALHVWGSESLRLSIELLEYSNQLREFVRNFLIWKWLLVAVLLGERTMPEDEQRQMHMKTVLNYVKFNYLLNVENLAEGGRSTITRRLKSMVKRQTKQLDRCTKLTNNIDVIKTVVSSILSLEPPDRFLDGIIKEQDEQAFYKRFFELWRERCHPPFLPPIRQNTIYTLCLDLDQTLICFDRSNEKLLVRPFVAEFLQRMAELFELVVFTSSLKEYANYMIDQIDPKRLISYRLYRENCTTINNRQRKDLSKLGRQLTRTFLVDNLEDNYLLQPKSGLAVSSWYGDPNDRALLDLAGKLQRLVADGRITEQF